jgi:hypothetical protein
MSTPNPSTSNHGLHSTRRRIRPEGENNISKQPPKDPSNFESIQIPEPEESSTTQVAETSTLRIPTLNELMAEEARLDKELQ